MSGRFNHESDIHLLIIYAEYCFSDIVHVYLLGGFIAIHASKFRIQTTAPGQPSPRLHRGSRCLPPLKQQLHQVEPTRRGGRACPSHPRQHGRLLPANNQFLERLDRRAVQVGLQRRDLRARPLEHPGHDGVTLALVRVEQRQVCRSPVRPGLPSDRRGQLPA